MEKSTRVIIKIQISLEKIEIIFEYKRLKGNQGRFPRGGGSWCPEECESLGMSVKKIIIVNCQLTFCKATILN